MKELLLVELDRLPDVDQAVLRILHALFLHEHFLIKLLAGSQSGECNINVAVRHIARQPDHILREIEDLHGLAHVEHEDLAALRIRAGLQHERNGLGDRHEISDDIGMSDRDGSALRDLLLKKRDNAAVAAEHIAEANGHELGLRAIVVGLNDHLAHALRRAHDVRGVDRFIGGNEHKTLNSARIRRHNGLQRTEDIVLDGLVGRILHERHMLVRSRVVNDLRPVFLEYLAHAQRIAHGSDQHDQIEVWMLDLEFLLDVVGIVLVDIDNDQLPYAVVRQLPAKLASDRTAAARDKHNLARDIAHDRVKVDLYGLAPEQILNIYVTQARECAVVAGHQLRNAGQHLQCAAHAFAYIDHTLQVSARSGRDRDNDLIDRVFLDKMGDRRRIAHDPDAMNEVSDLRRVVVDHAADRLVQVLAREHLANDHIARVTGSDDHDVAAAPARHVPAAEMPERPVTEARRAHKTHQHEEIDDRNAAGQLPRRDIEAREAECAREEAADHDVFKLVRADKLPQRIIKSQDKEQNYRENDEYGQHMQRILDILLPNRRERQVEPQQKRKHQRRADRQDVQEHQENLPDEFIPIMKCSFHNTNDPLSHTPPAQRVSPRLYIIPYNI